MHFIANHRFCWWGLRSGLGFHIHNTEHTFALDTGLNNTKSPSYGGSGTFLDLPFLNYKYRCIEVKLNKWSVQKNLNY